MVVVFDSLADALEEAAWCATVERTRYYVFIDKAGKFGVVKRHNGVRRQHRHIEVGFKHNKCGRKEDV